LLFESRKKILLWVGAGAVFGLLGALFFKETLEPIPPAGAKEALLACIASFFGIIAVSTLVAAANRIDICPRPATRSFKNVLAFFKNPITLFEAASVLTLGQVVALWIAGKFKSPDVFVPLCASVGVLAGTQLLRLWCFKRAKDEESGD